MRRWGGVTAVYLIIVALSAIYWGYRGDRTKRKPLLFYGTLLWGAAMILTALSHSFAWFLLFQMVTAVGVGGISSVGFSVVSDIIPVPRRGMALSLWSISQRIGAAGGALLAGTLGALDWRLPFLVIAGLGFLFTNPWVIFAFLVAFAAIALQSSDPSNWAAMLTDVNLPEHRGTVIGISRLFRAVGNALSVGAAGFLITALAVDYPSPDNYAITPAAFQFLVIPAGFCYYKVSQHIVKDRTAVTNTLKARAETAVSP